MEKLKPVDEYTVPKLKELAQENEIDISNVTRKDDIYKVIEDFSKMTPEEREVAKLLKADVKKQLKNVVILTVTEDIDCRPNGIDLEHFEKDQEIVNPTSELVAFLVNKKEIATLQNKKVLV